eukprot:CAMPEP_0119282044 /NCGR_PEP_ID=MMETSP1329-20130426/25984_1 /TAXON_ID=114041 /ORGANISM="Genus nov. species nov., Strain RCC1024" /LENGTH=120 /DNA_ID=CAMNT_0007282683 /DNA_START=88 /DNA_END=447 /DNA_ORIENTATION=+
MSSFPPAAGSKSGAQDKCNAALQALEAELAAQDEKFAALAKTMALTADSLGELYKTTDADTPVPVEVLENLRNIEIDLQRDGLEAASREASIDAMLRDAAEAAAQEDLVVEGADALFHDD